MFVCVNDFTSALSNLKHYKTKLKSEYEKIEILMSTHKCTKTII